MIGGIIAAGLGERLVARGIATPKPLIEIGGRPLIARTIDALCGAGAVSFDAGTFTVNTLSMGIKTAAGTGQAQATLNVGGGSFNVNTAFTLGSQASAGSS